MTNGYIYLGLFLAVLGQSTIGISLVVPGLSTILAATFLSVNSDVQLPLVFLIAWAASFLGDNIGYALGRTGIERLPWAARRFNKAKPKVRRFFDKYRRFLPLYVFLGYTRTPLPILLGSINYPLKRWLALSGGAITLFMTLFISGCYILARNVSEQAALDIIIVTQIVVATLIISAVIKVIIERRRRQA